MFSIKKLLTCVSVCVSSYTFQTHLQAYHKQQKQKQFDNDFISHTKTI